MIEVNNKSKCCGCNACGDICPEKAIVFNTDIEGFWYPVVNKDVCTNCGLCEKTCPIINITKLKKNDYEQSICYAAEHKNLEVVFDSTSGGMFSALADIMYKDNGFVGGAIFNDDFSVRHFISSDKKDLPKLRSSKYLQSNLEGFYQRVKYLLKKGEKVLVCGTPCQMAALRSFLKKNYENLIIADFICRGINSPKVWKKYLDSFEERYGSKVVYCKAKSKEYGWRNLTQKVILENGKEYYETKQTSNFTKGYLKTGVYCRPSCYECQFKGYPRISDITLADFWGIEKINKKLEKDLGTSLVMINSKKGESFFEHVKTHINFISVPFTSIENGNPSLNLPLAQPKVNRDQFFKDLDNYSFTEIASKYILFEEKESVINNFKRIYKLLFELKSTNDLFLKSFYQFIKFNFFSKEIKLDWKKGGFLYTTSHSVIEIHKNSKIILEGALKFGFKKFKKSKLESRLLVEDGAKLEVKGDFIFYYGADVEIFKNAELILKGKKHCHSSGFNIGATVICANRIEIGCDVQIGRNVTIRDNNGGHYISRQGYKDSRPIIIGDHAWLGEGCTIMPGVTIGEGAIIGARSLVISNVPAHSIVSGNPARVIDVDVFWKH